MPSKADRERFYLDAFLREAMLVPNSVTPGEDPPDFVVSFGIRRIAIALTEFFEDSNSPRHRASVQVEQEWNSLRQAIWDLQRLRPELTGVAGSLSSKEVALPPRKTHGQIASALLDLAAHHLRALTKDFVEFEVSPEPGLRGYFDFGRVDEDGTPETIELDSFFPMNRTSSRHTRSDRRASDE
jgi:hypothetical protein